MSDFSNHITEDCETEKALLELIEALNTGRESGEKNGWLSADAVREHFECKKHQ